MHLTKHMTTRMSQRNFSTHMVDAILNLGEWDARGDRQTLDTRQHPEINESLTELRRVRKAIDQKIRGHERLLRKGRVTVVAKDDSLITVYQNYKH
jgi:hypothetical protein